MLTQNQPAVSHHHFHLFRNFLKVGGGGGNYVVGVQNERLK